MSKIGVYFGSTTGTCEDVAAKIAEKLNGADVINVTSFSEKSIDKYDTLLLGSSTWGEGDLQGDWYDVCDKLKEMDLSGKKVALFCVGDSDMYPDSFCGALSHLYEAVKNSGATIVGQVDASGYNFSASEGVVDGKFLGLAIDEANEPDKTEPRIEAWIASLGL